MEISTETYPNALHVLKLNISTVGTPGAGGHNPQLDQANDIDGYGSPESPVISFNDFNVNNFEDEDISDDNDLAAIPQIPSANVPDQENPEKYINNEIETVNKVLNNPIFFYELLPGVWRQLLLASTVHGTGPNTIGNHPGGPLVG